MNNTQLKYLMSHPHALMQYSMTGREPVCRKPLATPLWTCLAQLSPQMRYRIKGITLCPALGYLCCIQFHTAEQLFDYLGGNQDIVGHITLASENYADKRFNKKIQLNDLLAHAATHDLTL